MRSFNFDNERKILILRRQKIERHLQTLSAQKNALGQTAYNHRRNVLFSGIHDLEHRLAESYLDERSLQHMEGRE